MISILRLQTSLMPAAASMADPPNDAYISLAMGVDSRAMTVSRSFFCDIALRKTKTVIGWNDGPYPDTSVKRYTDAAEIILSDYRAYVGVINRAGNRSTRQVYGGNAELNPFTFLHAVRVGVNYDLGRLAGKTFEDYLFMMICALAVAPKSSPDVLYSALLYGASYCHDITSASSGHRLSLPPNMAV